MDMFSASAIMGYVPSMMVALPFIGAFDFAPFIVATSIFVILTGVFALIRHVVLARLTTLSDKTSTDIDDLIIDAVRGIRPWAYSVVALFIALQFFALPLVVDMIARAVFFATLVWQAIEIALAFVRYGTKRILEKDEDGDGEVDPGAATASHMVTLIARIALWALGGIFVLSNLGVEVTSLLAGLGIGGIAVAFALQGVLSDLFASFSIYFDKPFRIGDYVVIGNDSGTIEKIGIKSTRIRTLQGEELVVSNAELTTVRIQNFKNMQERRIAFDFGVTYDTSREQVAEIPQIVADIVEETEDARLDRAHFTKFGDSALKYEVVYFVPTGDYARYLDLQQKINLAIMDSFAERGIEFAYPTQTIYHQQVS